MLTTLLLLCAVGTALAIPLNSNDGASAPITETCGYQSCTEADPNLLNVHIVPHTHDDVGWLKTVDQYYFGSRPYIQSACVQCIIDSVVKELWEDPKRRFMYVETAFLWKWWIRQSEGVKEKVRILVRQGRLQFVGGAWSMNDEAASHYQSTIDQFTWGLSKLNETFGPCATPRVGWQIDPFGHSREFASLLAAMGYDGLFLGRIDYQDKTERKQKKHMEMVWRGDDDLGKPSDLFTGVLYNTYSPPPGFCFDILCGEEPIVDDPNSPMYNVEERVSTFLEVASNISDTYSTNNVLVTMGGDFQFQAAAVWFTNLDLLIQYANLKAAKDGLNVKLFYSTPDCYLKAVKDSNPTLPTKQDDFFPYASDPHAYWTGYFTSRPTTKRFERETNSYLQMAKQLQSLAGLEDHNIFVLNELKSATGMMQHHDAITGTEKQHVTADYERILDSAIEDSLLIPRQAFNKILQGDALKLPIFTYDRCRLNESSCFTSETKEQFVVTVYNHLAWDVKEAIRVPVVEGSYSVWAPNGDQIDSQIVAIPDAVQKIPTRHSVATHEVVFIAHLKPVMFKSFYIKKIPKTENDGDTERNDDKTKLLDEVTRTKRDETGTHFDVKTKMKHKNEYYININDYWKEIKHHPNVDIKVIEEKPEPDVKFVKHSSVSSDVYAENKPIYDENVKVRDAKFSKDLDFYVMKDKDSVGRDVEEFVKFINEDVTTDGGDKKTYVSYKGVLFPNLNDEEMRMLSDDPMVVQRFDETYLENQHIKLKLDESTNEITASTFDGQTVKFSVYFYYYPGAEGNNREFANRSSGAYIFRPNASNPFLLESNYTQGVKGPVVTEIRGLMSENVANSILLYTGLNYIEHDWVVGPISISDNVGKEYVVRYETDIVNNGEFYTDSNGRQMLKRKLNQRPQFNLNVTEPISGNYYPVTNKIAIEDGKARMAVSPDRSEGGTSLQEGNAELMLHRRLLFDDGFGVSEALNEVANDKGLVVRGKHRIFMSKANDKTSYIEEKKQVLQFHLQPLVFISDASSVAFDTWVKLKNCYSFVNKLPEGLHLLTVEPRGKQLLVRLENYLELTDKVDEQDTVLEVDLSKIFKTIEVKSFRETKLAANQWLDGYSQWEWRTENEFEPNFYRHYGTHSNAKVNGTRNIRDNDDNGFKIKVKAKQIRTFVVDFEMKKF